MYRNLSPLLSHQGAEIEEGCLWQKDGSLMVLVDEDEYHTTDYSDLFIQI